MQEIIDEISKEINFNVKENVDVINDCDKIIERWEVFGFLNGMEGDKKKNCALSMELLSSWIIYKGENDEWFSYTGEHTFEVLGFPIIRRIYDNFDYNGVIEAEKLIEGAKITSEKAVQFIIDMAKSKNVLDFDFTPSTLDMRYMTDEDNKKLNERMDFEAEVCAKWTEYIYEYLNK